MIGGAWILLFFPEGVTMSDNIDVDPGTGTDKVPVKTYEDADGVQWAAGVCAYITAVGDPDTLQVVTPTTGLPVQQQTGHTFAVSAASLPLPSGAATESTLSALNSKITACNTGAVVIASGSVTVSGTVGVSGTVTVSGTVAATQSGTWNITNISGTISLPTGAATEATLAAPQKQEDTAHSAGATGSYLVALRQDSPTGTATSDGNYSALITDFEGRLWTNTIGAVAIQGNLAGIDGTVAVSWRHDHRTLTTDVVSASSMGDNTLIAAVADFDTQIFRLVLIAASDVTVTLKGGSTALTGAMDLKAGVPFMLTYDREPYFVVSSDDFIINLSAGVQVSGFVAYFLDG